MTDPMDALNGLQDALNAKTVQLRPCDLNSDLQVLLDRPNGNPRFTYASVEGKSVQAIALIVTAELLHGLPCFQVGYAVIESMRGKGIGTRILQQAIDELTHGLSRTPIKEFYLEAIVSDENVASNKIANRLISDSPVHCNDALSEELAYQYLRKVQCSI